MAFLPSLRGKSLRPNRDAFTREVNGVVSHFGAQQKAIFAQYASTFYSNGLVLGEPEWTIERAVAQAYGRVVWVMKATETISAHSSGLPVALGDRDTEKPEDSDLANLLNDGWANPLETGHQMRRRLSGQIQLSPYGAFVERTRNNGNAPMRYDLLPPHRTRAIPVEKGSDLVSHYEVRRPNGGTYRLEFEDVLWFRVPHVLDPFRAVTPLEAAGMSIELDFFARLYNTSFMRNDGRPGGVLAVRGKDPSGATRDIAPEHLDRLESKFGKGPQEAGKIHAITGEISYQDFGNNPRDMQYAQCVTPETLFTLSDGDLRRADALHAGDEVLSWDENERALTSATISDVWDKPDEVLYRVRTSRGRELVTTGNHPYWAAGKWRDAGNRLIDTRTNLAGWVLADQLAVGDQVRVAVDWATKGDTPEAEGWALGLLVGDGHLPERETPCLSSAEPAVVERFSAYVADMGCVLRSVPPHIDAGGVQRGIDYRIVHRDGNARGRKASPVREWLRLHGLLGSDALSKRVPAGVLTGGSDAMAGFLAGYLDADGTVSHSGYANPHIAWTSVNRNLLVQCQHMLALLGVQSNLAPTTTGSMPNGRPLWKLAITGRSQVANAARLFDCAHPEKAARLAAWGGVEFGGREYPDDHWLFDRVVEVERMAPGPTIAVSIAGTHTHVTGGIVTHNTSDIAKLEILSAWGVPESMMGYTAGRSFDNASQDERVFWTITMRDHNRVVTTGFAEDGRSEGGRDLWLDTSEVEVLQQVKRARLEDARTEVAAGLRSPYSYAQLAGIEDIEDTPHTRALYIPTGKTPIASRAADAEALGMGPVDGASDGDGGDGPIDGEVVDTPPELAATPADAVRAITSGTNGPAAAGGIASPAAAVEAVRAGQQRKAGVADRRAARRTLRIMRESETEESARDGERSSGHPDLIGSDLERAIAAHLMTAMGAALDRTHARLSSPKTRKGTRHWQPEYTVDTRVGTKAVDAARAVDDATVEDATVDAVGPLLAAAGALTAAAMVKDLTGAAVPPAAVAAAVQEAMVGIAGWVRDTMGDLARALIGRINEADQRGEDLTAIRDTIEQERPRLMGRLARFAGDAAHSAVSAARDATATAMSGAQVNPDPAVSADGFYDIRRVWRSKRDDDVRRTHRIADGQEVGPTVPFLVGGFLLRYPRDPGAPLRETAGCRCTVDYYVTTSTGELAPTGARATL